MTCWYPCRYSCTIPGTTTNFLLKWLSSTLDINGKLDSFNSGRNMIKLWAMQFWARKKIDLKPFKKDMCFWMKIYLKGSRESTSSRSMCWRVASMSSSHIGGFTWKDPDNGLNSRKGLESIENERRAWPLHFHWYYLILVIWPLPIMLTPVSQNTSPYHWMRNNIV